MCFYVDFGAEKWENTRVYKVVDPRYDEKGYARNDQWIGTYQGFLYEKGESYVIGTDQLTTDNGKSHSGFYVYKTLERASTQYEASIILELEVDPNDFLFTDGKDVATYRRVKVIGSVKRKR